LIAPVFGHAHVDRKRQRPLTGVNEVVLLPTAKGLTTEGIAAHLAEVFRARVPDANARITEKVIGEMTARSPTGGLRLGRRPTEQVCFVGADVPAPGDP
jgi:hypothetical protein